MEGTLDGGQSMDGAGDEGPSKAGESDGTGTIEFGMLGSRMGIDRRYLEAAESTVRRQLREYEAGERRAFDLAVEFPDSFTGRVMRAMTAIPYGETRTYGELADELGTAPRAVGGGCGRNPVPVVVPCHRVVRSDGSLGGFSSAGGVALKRRLLEHEAADA